MLTPKATTGKKQQDWLGRRVVVGGAGLTEALSARGEGVGGHSGTCVEGGQIGRKRAACWEVACEAGVGGWGQRSGGRGAEAQ